MQEVRNMSIKNEENRIEHVMIDSTDPETIKKRINEIVADKLKDNIEKIVIMFKDKDESVVWNSILKGLEKSNLFDQVNEKGWVQAICDLVGNEELSRDMDVIDNTFTEEMKEIQKKNQELENFIENRFGILPVHKQALPTLTSEGIDGVAEVYKKEILPNSIKELAKEIAKEMVKENKKTKKVKNEKRAKKSEKKHAVHIRKH